VLWGLCWVAESKNLTAYNASKQQCLASQVRMADKFWSRLKGLLGTTSLPAGQAVCLEGCRCIHMIGMLYAIDALFVDEAGKVVGLVNAIKPWRISAYFSKAVRCLELPAGTIAATRTVLGDVISLQ
jgi:uncharacterized protein